MRFHMPLEIDSGSLLPAIVLGYASFRSQGGKSIFDIGHRLPQVKTTKPFHGKPADRKQAIKAVESMGFEILAESDIGVALAGAPGAWEEMTGGKIVPRERLMHVARDKQRYVTHLDIIGDKQPTAMGRGRVRSASTHIEGVVLERPRVPHAVHPSPLPPAVSTWHLRVPDDVAVVLGAKSLHQAGQRGDGVSVAMVDTGQYAHPFFKSHHYTVKHTVVVVPGTSGAKDPIGHGTGESANIFALAPGAVLHPFRASNQAGALVGSVAGFMKAKASNPQILTNSWGGDNDYPPAGGPPEEDVTIALEIKHTIEQGILVVFSAGNGHFSIEPQVPGVLAAGGVFLTPEHHLIAADYASGYTSPWFQGRIVPDVCGLVGMQPRAQFLMLPVPPECELDTEESNPDEQGNPGDGTETNDGWAMFSGTSAAAPQLAGAAALVLGAKPGLRPAQVIEALTATAIDVTAGHSFPQRFNSPAGPGVDAATGAGLVNAAEAVKYAIDRF